MTSERFTLVRATGLTRVGGGGGVEGEDIVVHRMRLAEVPASVAAKQREGVAIDAKVLVLLALIPPRDGRGTARRRLVVEGAPN